MCYNRVNYAMLTFWIFHFFLIEVSISNFAVTTKPQRVYGASSNFIYFASWNQRFMEKSQWIFYSEYNLYKYVKIYVTMSMSFWELQPNRKSEFLHGHWLLPLIQTIQGQPPKSFDVTRHKNIPFLIKQNKIENLSTNIFLTHK